MYELIDRTEVGVDRDALARSLDTAEWPEAAESVRKGADLATLVRSYANGLSARPWRIIYDAMNLRTDPAPK